MVTKSDVYRPIREFCWLEAKPKTQKNFRKPFEALQGCNLQPFVRLVVTKL